MEEEPSHTVDVFRLEPPPEGLWQGNAQMALQPRPLVEHPGLSDFIP